MTHADVGEILRLTNRALVRDCIDECFVTLILARLDTETGLLTYASAGHPSSYVLGSGGELKHVLESTSLPLGVVGEAEFVAASPIQLSAGDVLIMLTDGITEAFGQDGTTFGADRALELVRRYQHESAAEIVRQLDSAVTAFAHHRTRQDDTTSLVVKWSGVRGLIP
jgi:serine phosphatase RsbU (regulator of sigma subunit)